MNIAVVVLAGGEGRRMQGGKPFRILAGRTLLDRALERARTMAPSSFAVAVRSGSVEGVRTLLDDPSIPGPLAGVASALAFAAEAGADAVLTIPCDAPFLPDDLALRLPAALRSDIGAAVAVSNGRLHPACALWRAGIDGKLHAYAASGRASLTGFAEAVGFAPVDWSAEPFDPFFNVNTPEDLEGAEQLIRR